MCAGDTAVFTPHGSNAGESGSSLGSESSLCVDLPFDNRFFASTSAAAAGGVTIVDFFFDGRAATVVETSTLPPLPPPLPLPPHRCPRCSPRCRPAAEVLRPDPLDALRLPPEEAPTREPPEAPVRLLPPEAPVPPRGVRPPRFVSAAWWNWVREPLDKPCTDPSPEPPLLPPLLAPLSRGARLSMACARSSFLRWRTAVHVLFLPLKASTPCRT